jgi:hypothetical protein
MPLSNGSNGIARCCELPFQPLVPIQTELGGVGEIGTELDEQGAEVAIQDVDVVVIGHGRRADDPRIGLPGRVVSFLGAEHAGLLLGLADEEHALLACERGEVRLRDVVLPLPLLEGHQIEALRRDEALDRRDEPLTHRGDHHGGGHPHAELCL